MDSQLLATLHSRMTDMGMADLDPSRLKPFYTHCARLPLAHDGKHVVLPLKSLLLNYTHLRPEVKISLNRTLHERWRRFAEGTPQLLPRVVEDQPDPEPVPPPTLLLNAAPPDDSRANARPVMEDWFDRFLNGVRCLLFL